VVRIVALALVLVLAGCGSTTAITAPPGVSTMPPGSKDCRTVTIAVNPWVGYRANVAVVRYLLERELGCTVIERELTEQASWEGIADGTVDVILENWGHDDLKKKYIDDTKTAVELGLTGNKGVIGWYVPPWLATAYPGITNWKNLNKYAGLFQGVLLDGDPSFVTNDAALVKNLKLNLTVEYAGSEDKLIAAFRAAEADRTPLIGYFDPKAVACDYQPYDLDKIARREFADPGSPAAALIKNFAWTNADQNSVARDLTVTGLPPDQAAKRWLDAHQEVWESWLI
jgi:glycine betaine/proline transport system substrate-binding protein